MIDVYQRDDQPITAYRLSKKGYELMNRLTDEDRAAVDSVIRVCMCMYQCYV